MPDYIKKIRTADGDKQIDYGALGNHPHPPNPNLLDNAYFVGGGSQQGGGQLPINQRGETSYSGNVYGIDRWKGNANIGVDILTTGLKVTATAGSTQVVQIIENSDDLRGKKVTLSALTSSGSLLKTTVTLPDSIPTSNTTIGTGTEIENGYNLYVRAQSGKFYVSIWASSQFTSAGLTLVAVKLELGDTQTLAHQENGVWVLNELPDYQEELVRCKTSIADPNDPYANQENLVGFQTRPNLIDNWYFAGGGSQQGEGYLPINQRGQTSYSGAIAYTIDRWKTSNTNTTVTVSSAGLTFSAVTGATPYLLQPLGKIEKLRGKTVTASFLIGNQLYSKTDVFPVNDPSDISAICGISQVGQILYMSGAWFMRLIGSIASSNPYIAVKFEVGNSQTLAHWDSVNGAWVLSEVPNYEEQLFRCQTANADVTMDNYANKENLVGFQVRPNLLDNAYFIGGGSQSTTGAFPINQRGASNYTTNSAYSIDRWYKRSGSATISMESSGLKILCTASISAGAYLLDQTLEFPQKYRGMPFTCSILVDSIQGTWAFGLRDAGGTTNVTSTALSAGLVSVSGTIQSDTTDLRFALLSGSATVSNNYVIIKAVKFEIGSTQTLAHQENGTWVLNEVPNYQQELARCQRFAFSIGTSSPPFFVGTTGASSSAPTFFVPTPVSMRTNPTVTGMDSVNAQFAGGYKNNVSLSGISCVANNNGIRINATASEAITSNAYENASYSNRSTVLFSADL